LTALTSSQSDWFHTEYFKVVESAFAIPLSLPQPDNNLINGRMNFSCSETASGTCNPNAGFSKFRFTTGKTHRLRLINTGSEGTQKFTIDNHTMTVIANDFVPIVPYTTNVVTLGIGQRTDILVTANGNPSDVVWMRSDISALCSPSAPQRHALAAIYYPEANTAELPNTAATSYTETNCTNDALSNIAPFFPIIPPAAPMVTQTMDISVIVNASGVSLFAVDGSSFRANYE
jgi:FtsP/CotA-like multicopper oxidase with cupredoxin domain